MVARKSTVGDLLSIDRTATAAGALLVLLTWATAYFAGVPIETMYGAPGLVAGLSVGSIHYLDGRRGGDGLASDGAVAGGIGTLLGIGLVLVAGYVTVYSNPIVDYTLLEFFSRIVLGNVGQFALFTAASAVIAGSVGWGFSRLDGTDEDRTGVASHDHAADGPESEAVERLKEQYATGTITEREFERKVARIVEREERRKRGNRSGGSTSVRAAGGDPARGDADSQPGGTERGDRGAGRAGDPRGQVDDGEREDPERE